MPTFRRLLPASLLGLALLASGCGGHPDVERQISVRSGPSGAVFEPTTITVNKDDNVTLAVGNPTTTVHGFSIEGYGIQDEVPPGGFEKRFQARHPGTFKIYCQLHETHQIATLVVR
ncbi:MAG TPA: cupredoxin domain-containing protein [Acidimicrobiales bacterium]|nr:cupredoxin domain-containing protein [Acidimicrobiales bacterium]